MSSIPEEYFYFEPDFDANRITIPQLRSILLKHSVQYPASAKKPVLVELFNQKVAPQGPKLLKAQSRTKPSARGIEDVPSSQASTADDVEEEDETLLPPPTTTKRTSRRSARAATEESERAAPVSRAKSSRTSSAKHARSSDVEVEERPAPRRTRHSVTPAVKEEFTDPKAWHDHDGESPFSNDNPFQSGSSPPVPDSKTSTRERRRKTLGPLEHKEKRKSETNRRKTVQPPAEQWDEGIVAPRRTTFEVPISKIAKKEEPQEEVDFVEAGEEFTPQEQLELVRERAGTGQADILPPRRRRQTNAMRSTVTMGAWAVICVLFATLGGLWREEKIAVGYCGMGRRSTSLGNVEVPEWATPILPECEPCPPHAICYGNMETRCEDDFVLKPHPLSLRGLVPLPPTCEPDSVKQRKISAVTDKSVEVLRDRRAQFECGDLLDKEGKPVPSAEVGEAELKQEVSAKRRKGMSQDEFDDLWKSAIGEIVKREEVVSNSDGLVATATESVDSDSHQHPLSNSHFPAPSGDSSEQPLNDIFGSLLG